jgi:flagellar biosynthetic protein FlhB
MAEEEQSGEKTEEPTQKRLEKAREEGQMLRSQELSVAVVVMTALLMLMIIGPSLYSDLLGVFHLNLAADNMRDPQLMLGHLGGAIQLVLPSLLLMFGAIMLMAIVANSALGGFTFNPKSFLPKANRLNPISGLKRIFGFQAWYELLKGILKTLLIMSATYLMLRYFEEEIKVLGVLPDKLGIYAAGDIVSSSILVIALMLVIIAMLDVPVKIKQHHDKLKMTKQEVKDEYKDTEGKPEIRSRIRQRQREIALNKMMKAIEKADVVITNPQHFAVALSYTPGSSQAPVVLGKGIDFIAQQIRRRAEELDIPIFEAPALARAIYFSVAERDEIPELLYHAVAQVIAYVFSLSTNRGNAKTMQKPTPVVPESLLFDADGKLIN